MSEHSMEKPIAEQMLDWAERLDKRFYLFNKESLYNWLITKALRVAQLKQENEKLKAGQPWLKGATTEYLLKKANDALWEYFHAHIAVEAGLANFDLHNEAVDRLEQARDSVVLLIRGVR